jgi:hypothetical protein
MSELINPILPLEEDSPETRDYLVILRFKPVGEYDDDEFDGLRCKFVVGRSEAYLLLFGNRDKIILTKSYVIAQKATLEEMITAYVFMQHCHSLNPYNTFDIDEYLDEEYDDIEVDDEDENEEYYEPDEEDYIERKNNFSNLVKQNSKIQQEMMLSH